MKNNWKHLTFEQRKVIVSGIAKSMKLREIAELIDMNPTSVSKEVKRNRIPYKNVLSNECPKLNRWPYVCSCCHKRYQPCIYKKYKYMAKPAQKQADIKLVNSRRGLDLTREEHEIINNAVSVGFDNGKSIYQIKKDNNIKQSISTLYSYVNKGVLDKKRYDLPFANNYKKRKHKKQYDYSTSSSKIDRTGHSYINFITFMKQNPWCNYWQMDFLGSKKTDIKAIHTMIMPDIQFPLLKLIEKPNANKVVEYFDYLEELLSPEIFSKIFQVVLTDRDPCFSDIEGLETSKITGKQRLHIFYCDPYTSSQKANIENLNKQIRRFFPKEKSTNNYNKEYICNTNSTIVNTPKKSLDGATPKEAFINLFTKDIFDKLIF